MWLLEGPVPILKSSRSDFMLDSGDLLRLRPDQLSGRGVYKFICFYGLVLEEFEEVIGNFLVSDEHVVEI